MNNKTSWETPARPLARGIGLAVASRTILRKQEDGTQEQWADVAYRVALGNSMLRPEDSAHEFEAMHKHLRQASVLMSGRHLQHGDETQPGRNIEVYSNCSTSASTFILFYLLLNGSGVGRAYDDDMMLVDWSANMPFVIPVIRADHPDVLSGEIGQEFVTPAFPAEADEKNFMGTNVYMVPDSREGWAKAVEQVECATWEGNKGHSILLMDFSEVRSRGEPIKGMQGRPASGPGPLMIALKGIASLKNTGMPAWEATMHADHHAAECVLVGGARRAARMATKSWRDESVFRFITIKQGGVLWSSNNSVTVDEEFWAAVKEVNAVSEAQGLTCAQLLDEGLIEPLEAHAWSVFEAICKSSYLDGTGEPGLINVERLTQKDEGIEELFDGKYAESDRFKLDEPTAKMTAELAKVFAKKKFKQIVNPCGEISLSMIGAYCLIADVVPYHADATRGNEAWDNDAEEAFRVATRALLRTNTMNALYQKEVDRTNRIGVGITGFHEYAWSRFGFTWKDIINEEKSIEMWKTLSRFSNACVEEALKYSDVIGINAPHTVTTIKPAGTTSKLFSLSEGVHLPALAEYLRWVQFRSDDPLIQGYRDNGYPVRDLVTYTGTTIVGFPTVPEICKLGMGDKLVIAPEATPEEQYEFLRLLEKWWIDGYQEGIGRHTFGNQVSYTLKLDKKKVSFEEYSHSFLEGQSTVKCCSVMPDGDNSAYEYLPETPVSREEFSAIVAAITDDSMKEDIGFEHIDCGTGGCPIDFSEEEKAA
jgi:hypothetical protein